MEEVKTKIFSVIIFMVFIMGMTSIYQYYENNLSELNAADETEQAIEVMQQEVAAMTFLEALKTLEIYEPILYNHEGSKSDSLGEEVITMSQHNMITDERTFAVHNDQINIAFTIKLDSKQNEQLLKTWLDEILIRGVEHYTIEKLSSTESSFHHRYVLQLEDINDSVSVRLHESMPDIKLVPRDEYLMIESIDVDGDSEGIVTTSAIGEAKNQYAYIAEETKKLVVTFSEPMIQNEQIGTRMTAIPGKWVDERSYEIDLEEFPLNQNFKKSKYHIELEQLFSLDGNYLSRQDRNLIVFPMADSKWMNFDNDEVADLGPRSYLYDWVSFSPNNEWFIGAIENDEYYEGSFSSYTIVLENQSEEGYHILHSHVELSNHEPLIHWIDNEHIAYITNNQIDVSNIITGETRALFEVPSAEHAHLYNLVYDRYDETLYALLYHEESTDEGMVQTTSIVAIDDFSSEATIRVVQDEFETKARDPFVTLHVNNSGKYWSFHEQEEWTVFEDRSGDKEKKNGVVLQVVDEGAMLKIQTRNEEGKLNKALKWWGIEGKFEHVAGEGGNVLLFGEYLVKDEMNASSLKMFNHASLQWEEAQLQGDHIIVPQHSREALYKVH